MSDNNIELIESQLSPHERKVLFDHYRNTMLDRLQREFKYMYEMCGELETDMTQRKFEGYGFLKAMQIIRESK